MIQEEYQHAATQVLEVADIGVGLKRDPPRRLSLGRRNPYLAPLTHIQIVLLRRYRDPARAPQVRERWLIPCCAAAKPSAGAIATERY